ncbi:hypothetical protein ACIGXM_00450 [Kitasatospora sp. NPDC052896]
MTAAAGEQGLLGGAGVGLVEAVQADGGRRLERGRLQQGRRAVRALRG